MIGGEQEPVDALAPIFASIAPGVGAAPRTPGRSGDLAPEEQGYLHCGPNGAGHFVKMVHNGIEYGLMAAYAEGLNILANADAGVRSRDNDAETAPLERPEHYQYALDLPAINPLPEGQAAAQELRAVLAAARLSGHPRREIKICRSVTSRLNAPRFARRLAELTGETVQP